MFRQAQPLLLARAKEDVQKAQSQANDPREAMEKGTDIALSATEEISGLLDEDQKLLFQSKLKAAANAPADTGPGGRAGQGPGGQPGGFAGRGDGRNSRTESLAGPTRSAPAPVELHRLPCGR